MGHWSDRYVGMPYVDGAFDCGALAELVQKEVFGKEIHIPSDRRYAGKEGAARLRAMASQIAQEQPALAEPVDAPREGDGVLLKARGYPQHIGIYCELQGEPWVLHAADTSRQVVRCRIRDLAFRALSVEGYYRWI